MHARCRQIAAGRAERGPRTASTQAQTRPDIARRTARIPAAGAARQTAPCSFLQEPDRYRLQMARFVALSAASPRTRDRHLARAGRLAWDEALSRGPLLMLPAPPRRRVGSQ